MNSIVKIKQMILAAGDILILYLSLALTLLVRYDQPFNTQVLDTHLGPFTYIFIFWIFIFYVAGLYEIRHLKNNIDFLKKFGAALIVNAGLAITAFYILPLDIAPKTNLFILLAFFAVLGFTWRHFYNRLISSSLPSTNVLLIGNNDTTEEMVKQVESNPQLGYAIKYWLKDDMDDKEIDHISQIIISENINLIAIPEHIKKDSKTARAIYRNLALGIETIDIASFYERIFKKVPLSELSEVWFLENLVNQNKVYETIKQPCEIIAAFIMLIILSPLMVLLGLLVKLTSRGSVIYKQARVGQYESQFTLYKFRTMTKDAEKEGAQWSQKNDARITALGKLLRRSHLDELPQLLNIIKGEASFVGPRPERPEFTEDLKKTIPHYELRHLVRPGIAGWAQLNYRYGASVEDTYQKLQYDIFYLKNKSFWLDLSIVIKTLKMFFVKN
jgi:exopolysaccharide biosynthesis polyprenyl glycosylphosphotransferase